MEKISWCVNSPYDNTPSFYAIAYLASIGFQIALFPHDDDDDDDVDGKSSSSNSKTKAKKGKSKKRNDDVDDDDDDDDDDDSSDTLTHITLAQRTPSGNSELPLATADDNEASFNELACLNEQRESPHMSPPRAIASSQSPVVSPSALESMQLVRVQAIFARFLSRFHLSHFRSFFALIACLVCALLGTESDAARAWVVCRIVVFKYHCRRQAPLQRKLLHRGKCHRRKRRSLRLPWRVGRPAEATAECRHR